MSFLSTIFGSNQADNNKLNELLLAGAILIDVRSSSEFKSGSVKGAINIPVIALADNIDKIIRYNKPIITFCASGARSAQATKILNTQGLVCENAGTWQKLNQLI